MHRISGYVIAVGNTVMEGKHKILEWIELVATISLWETRERMVNTTAQEDRQKQTFFIFFLGICLFICLLYYYSF